MAVYAPEKDWEYLTKQDPRGNANLQLYRQGTTLKQGDVALGGTAAAGGISDQYLGGGKRLYGETAEGTAGQYYKYLADQQKQANATQATQYQTDLASAQANAQPAPVYNTMESIIGNDPEARAYYDAARQAAQTGSRSAMEQLNARGILNSSITGEQVGQLEQQAMTNVLPQLYGIKAQRDEAARQSAYQKLQMLGYADNEVSKTLGVPVGTKSADFQFQEAGLTGMYQGQRTAQQQAADQAAYQFEKSYGLSVGEAIGMIGGNRTLQKLAQEIANEQFTASYQQNAQQFAQSQAQQQAQFNASLAAGNASGGGGGGGSSGGSSGSRSSSSKTSTASKTAATKASNLAQAQADIQSAYNRGGSYDDIVASIKSNAATIANTPGITQTALKAYAEKIRESAEASQRQTNADAGAYSALNWMTGGWN